MTDRHGRPTEGGYEGLGKLMGNRDRVSALRIWKAQTMSERRIAIEYHCQQSHSSKEEIVDAVAEAKGFRVQTVGGWPVEKLAEELSRFSLRSPRLARDLLIALHLADRRRLLAAFLDELGLGHENGQLTDGALGGFETTSAEVHAAADALLEAFDPRSVAVYFLTLIVLRQFGFSEELWQWLQGQWETVADERSGDPKTAEAEPVDEQVDESDESGLTTLDRLLILAAVDMAQGVEGALSTDALDDVVGELVQLNAGRHRSFFHAGFIDALLGRPPKEVLPGQNQPRLRWYWAGAVQGWARQGRWQAITEAYDEAETPVATLGDGKDEPSSLAVNWIAEALVRSGRLHELAGFVKVAAIAKSPLLYQKLLDAATSLLRSEEGAAARQILDPLTTVADDLVEQGFVPATSRFLEARRRKAHCHRQLGERVQARKELEALLDVDQDPGVQAMIHADLGLIDGGFKMLSEVHLDGSDPDLITEALQAGSDRFQKAVELNSRYSSHGHYCLGVLCAGEEDWERAVLHLEQARAGFRSHPERYRTGGLVARTDVYYGIALAHVLEADKLLQASKALEAGLTGGASIPRQLLGSTLKHLDVGGSALLQPVIEAILAQDAPYDPLDELAQLEEARGATVVGTALYARGQDSDRGDHARARDLRTALAAHLASGDVDTASEILDQLEELALEGVAAAEMIALLSEPTGFEPAWSTEDAAISLARCQESIDDYEGAAATLDSLSHRLLSQERPASMAEVQGILERIDAYPVSDDLTLRLRQRVDALAEGDEPIRLKESRKTLKILVVGGDERNEKDDEPIRELLAEESDRIRVNFIRPGWSGNWSKALDDTKRALKKHDALVLMRFVRTEFGKQVRKACVIPWRSCYGAGRNLVVRTILEAAAAVDS